MLNYREANSEGYLHGDNIECFVEGCSLIMKKIWREDKKQYYLRCYGTGEYRHNDYSKSCTVNSIFYNRKIKFNILFNIMIQYFQRPSVQHLFDTNSVARSTITSIVNDCHLLMQNDWLRYDDGSIIEVREDRVSGFSEWWKHWWTRQIPDISNKGDCFCVQFLIGRTILYFRSSILVVLETQ